MERNRPDLEHQAGYQEQDGQGKGQPRWFIRGQRHGYARQFRCPGQAVNQGQPVEENTRRDRAQDDVFEGGLVGLRVAAQVTGQHVEGQGLQFQPHVDDQQVAAGSHDHHARQGEQDERVIFPFCDALLHHITPRHEKRQGRRQVKHRLEEIGESVDHEYPAIGRLRRAGEHGGHRRGEQDYRQRQTGQDGHLMFVLHERDEQQQAGAEYDDDLGGGDDDRADDCLLVHRRGPQRPRTWISRWSREGPMTSRKGVG